MMGLLILELVTLVAMFSSLFAVLFNPGQLYGVIASGFFYFVITLVVYALTEKKPRLKWVYVLLFAPIMMFGSNPYYVLMPLVIIYYMVKEKDFGKLDFRYFIKSFYVLLVSVYTLMLIFEDLFPEFLTERIHQYWQIPLFFFFSSIQFLRVLRFTEVNMHTAYIRKQNVRFGLFSIFVFVTAVYDGFRESLFLWIRNGFTNIVHLILKPIYAFMETENQVELPPTLDKIPDEQAVADMVLNTVKPGESPPTHEGVVNVLSFIVDAFSVLLLISLFAFVVYKLIKGLKRSSKQVVSDQLIIERTTIVKTKDKVKRKRRWFLSKNAKEEIRHLYLKHMERLDVVDDIGCTTQRVYQVGLETEVVNPLNVREIYREIRYNPNASEGDAKSQLDTFKRALK